MGSRLESLRKIFVEERVDLMHVDEAITVEQTQEHTLVKLPEPPTPFAYILSRRIRPLGKWHMADYVLVPRKETPVALSDPVLEQPMPENLLFNGEVRENE